MQRILFRSNTERTSAILAASWRIQLPYDEFQFSTAERLDLTAEQRQRLEKIEGDLRKKNWALKGRMHDERDALDKAEALLTQRQREQYQRLKSAGRRRQGVQRFMEPNSSLRAQQTGCPAKRRSWRRQAERTYVNVLVIDVGGTHVKVLASGERTPRRFASGPRLTARQMVSKVKGLVRGLDFQAVAIGYPGLVLRNRPVAEPHNLGREWAGFDFEAAFGRPVKVMNDAAMQALGSYEGGKMLFLGLGTGLGSALIVDGIIEPMELGHLPYRKGTYEDYVGVRGLARLGNKKWRRHVFEVVERLSAALEPDDIVLGGGNVKKLKALPPGCRAGDNANAFKGGFRVWQETAHRRTSSRACEHGRGAKPPTRSH